jgi:DNA polymerase (family 10)
MKKVGEFYQNIELAGSLRRRKETVGDIDLLVSADKRFWSALHERRCQLLASIDWGG